VTGGFASVVYGLPPGTPVGSYTILAAYSGTRNVVGSTNLLQGPLPTVRVGIASTSTVAENARVSYSEEAVNATLTATIGASGGSTLSAGIVTFQLTEGTSQVGAAVTSATVTTGATTVLYSLPPGTPVGNYSIIAKYNGTNNFLISSDVK